MFSLCSDTLFCDNKVNNSLLGLIVLFPSAVSNYSSIQGIKYIAAQKKSLRTSLGMYVCLEEGLPLAAISLT